MSIHVCLSAVTCLKHTVYTVATGINSTMSPVNQIYSTLTFSSSFFFGRCWKKKTKKTKNSSSPGMASGQERPVVSTQCHLCLLGQLISICQRAANWKQPGRFEVTSAYKSEQRELEMLQERFDGCWMEHQSLSALGWSMWQQGSSEKVMDFDVYVWDKQSKGVEHYIIFYDIALWYSKSICCLCSPFVRLDFP